MVGEYWRIPTKCTQSDFKFSRWRLSHFIQIFLLFYTKRKKCKRRIQKFLNTKTCTVMPQKGNNETGRKDKQQQHNNKVAFAADIFYYFAITRQKIFDFSFIRGKTHTHTYKQILVSRKTRRINNNEIAKIATRMLKYTYKTRTDGQCFMSYSFCLW